MRFYRIDPNSNYIENVHGAFYPQETTVLDPVDCLPKLKKWLRMTPQNMGNWVTKEDIFHSDLFEVNIVPVPVAREIPLEKANELLRNNSKLLVIGFDMLQIPGYKIVFTSNFIRKY